MSYFHIEHPWIEKFKETYGGHFSAIGDVYVPYKSKYAFLKIYCSEQILDCCGQWYLWVIKNFDGKMKLVHEIQIDMTCDLLKNCISVEETEEFFAFEFKIREKFLKKKKNNQYID